MVPEKTLHLRWLLELIITKEEVNSLGMGEEESLKANHDHVSYQRKSKAKKAEQKLTFFS